MKWFSRLKKSNEWAENPTPVRLVGGVRVGGTHGAIANGMGGEAGAAAERKEKFEYKDRNHTTVDISGGHELTLSTMRRTEAERYSRCRIHTLPYDSGKVRVDETGDEVLGNCMGGPAGSCSVQCAWVATSMCQMLGMSSIGRRERLLEREVRAWGIRLDMGGSMVMQLLQADLVAHGLAKSTDLDEGMALTLGMEEAAV